MQKFFDQGSIQVWQICIWSRRWMEAEMRLAKGAAERKAAAEAHVRRVRGVEGVVKERVATGKGANSRDYLEADYFRAEADIVFSRNKDQPLAQASMRDLERNRLAAARLIYDECWNEMERGRPVAFRLVYDWSSCWLEAELSIREEEAQRRQSVAAHLERMQRVERLGKFWAEGGRLWPYDFNQISFFRLDAEARFLQMEGDAKKGRKSDVMAARIEAAKATYDKIWATFLAGSAYPEEVYTWSMYCYKSTLGGAVTKVERVGATEAHLYRVKELERLVKDSNLKGREPTRAVYATNFFRAEAECFVEEQRARGRGDRLPRP